MVFIQEASHAFPLARWRSAIRRTIESVENRHEIYFAQFPHEHNLLFLLKGFVYLNVFDRHNAHNVFSLLFVDKAKIVFLHSVFVFFKSNLTRHFHVLDKTLD